MVRGKAKELMILRELRHNSRESLTNISKRTGIPISSLFDWIRHSSESLVLKNTALLDFEALGYNARVNATLKCKSSELAEIIKFLKASPHINNLYKVCPEFNLAFEAVFPQIKQFDRFLSELEERFDILDRKVFYIVEDIKREEFLSGLELSIPDQRILV
jgi:DNA-binding Lrp family transcriptional regulator